MKRLDIATDALCDGCGNEHRACTCARPATAPAPLDGAVAREVSAAVEAERRRCLAIIDRELRESVDDATDARQMLHAINRAEQHIAEGR